MLILTKHICYMVCKRHSKRRLLSSKLPQTWSLSHLSSCSCITVCFSKGVLSGVSARGASVSSLVGLSSAVTPLQRTLSLRAGLQPEPKTQDRVRSQALRVEVTLGRVAAVRRGAVWPACGDRKPGPCPRELELWSSAWCPDKPAVRGPRFFLMWAE